MDTEKQISIFEYLNYRKFLSDYFQELKKKEGLTLRLFAHRAGFSAHAYLQQIIDGKKSATAQSAWKIAKGFNLNQEESEFLELLIRFDQAQTNQEKNDIYKKIIKIKPKDKLSKIEKDHYYLFSNWYVFAIREMVTMPEFREDYQWIADSLKPKISKKVTKEAIELLLSLGYLKRDDNGNLIPAELNITTGAEVKSLHVFNYHNNLLHLASRSMENTEAHWRDISSTSFAINKEEFRFIKERIKEFRKEILQYLSDRRKGIFNEEIAGLETTIYNLNMQLFNSTRIKWNK